MSRIPFFGLLLVVAGCHATERVTTRIVSAELVDRWALETVYQDGQDVTAQHDPSDDRWFEFAADGTFVSDGDPHGRNTGKWTLNPATNELHIDSDAGEDDDSYWTVRVTGDTMRWKGARFDWNKRFELVHLRQ